MSNRVQQIVIIQKAVEVPLALASQKKWAESHLIWQEHNENGGKSFPKLSEEIKSAGGRGSSLGYLSRMERCWRLMASHGMDKIPYVDLPSFQDTYRSDQIQEGEPDRDKRQERNNKQDREQKHQDYTAHNLIETAINSIGTLRDNPAYWPLLTDRDVDELRALPAIIRALVRDIGRH